MALWGCADAVLQYVRSQRRLKDAKQAKVPSVADDIVAKVIGRLDAGSAAIPPATLACACATMFLCTELLLSGLALKDYSSFSALSPARKRFDRGNLETAFTCC